MTRTNDVHTATSMRPYLLPVMIQEFGDKCAICGKHSNSYEIDHKRYGDGITMYDLQLLCANCHWNKTESGHEGHLSRTPHCATCACYDSVRHGTICEQ
jgi:hypothetical protein